MNEKTFDLTEIQTVDELNHAREVNQKLSEGWKLLKVTESQWRDDDGALKSTIVYIVGHKDSLY
ncbi:hypothetical protein SM094_000488 [Cronobacter malonaticus]|nr:hypothetical protein [Cronobacter malonaticus]